MFKDSFGGNNGFEELRKFIKQGNEFSRDVATIMQERSELEAGYAKSLSKLSNKLSKSATGCVGTLASAWSMAATEMEAQSELHRSLGQALNENIHKPMKNLADTQSKLRKPIETQVDKAIRAYSDRKADEHKGKKSSYTLSKEREKLNDQLTGSRSGKTKMSERDSAKLEKKVRSHDEMVQKSDRDYHDNCYKSEQARQEWELSVYKASAQMQTLEEERICQMQDLLNKYNSHISVIGPKLVQSCERLNEAILSVNTAADLHTVVDQKSTGPNQPEQQLLDFFAEDFSYNMDAFRRRQALQNYSVYLQQDIEREAKGKEGVQKLVDVYQSKPDFADAEAQEDARQRLANVGAMISFFEACFYKVSCALAQMDGQTKPTSQYSQYIEITRDKQGMNNSVLRMPISTALNGTEGAIYRGHADGGRSESPYDAHPEKVNSFRSSRPPLHRPLSVGSKTKAPKPPHSGGSVRARMSVTSSSSEWPEDDFDDTPMGRCQAIYDYDATQHDELTIRTGEVINVFFKQEDGWWHGELNGQQGMFPATYVQEIAG